MSRKESKFYVTISMNPDNFFQKKILTQRVMKMHTQKSNKEGKW